MNILYKIWYYNKEKKHYTKCVQFQTEKQFNNWKTNYNKLKEKYVITVEKFNKKTKLFNEFKLDK